VNLLLELVDETNLFSQPYHQACIFTSFCYDAEAGPAKCEDRAKEGKNQLYLKRELDVENESIS
jgi:hypothetical protein